MTQNLDFFDDIDTEQKAYWFGFVTADGYVTDKRDDCRLGVSLMASDGDHLRRLASIFDVPARVA